MQVSLTELERQTLNRLLRAICLGGDLNAVLESISMESGQSTALHHIMDKTNTRQLPSGMKLQKLKELLNKPLPGGRGFQQQYYDDIQRLCREIAGE